jgi:hypothetical protein
MGKLASGGSDCGTPSVLPRARSRRRKSRDNAGEFMLLHKASSTVLLGAGFTATLEMILEFMEREGTALAGAGH